MGEQYKPAGVCMVSLNINNAEKKDDGWWTIGVEYAIAETAIKVLEQGGYRPHRSWFAYRSMATALAVLVSVDGHDPVEQPTPQEAAAAYERVARVQAIKCSPTHNRSQPTKAMQVNCPERFARRERNCSRPEFSLHSVGMRKRRLDCWARRPGASTATSFTEARSR